jgi:tetratricopeptide (TPR) repeat protein
LLFLGFGLVGWDFFRNARRDKIEAALVAGLFAVSIHNLVDFGFEIPGVLLPFLAILATVLGRRSATVARVPIWCRWTAIGLAGAGCIIGIASTLLSSSNDFDVELRRARSVAETKEILNRARAAHPVDYFYVLAYARLEPLRGPAGQPSPRLHALNQALLLCPGCEAVHLEVGQNLWALGMRRQALLEYRSAVTLQPTLFTQVLGELFAKGARPEELASIATFQPARMIDLARFLSAAGRVEDAIVVLGQAETVGASRADVLLSKAAFQLQLGQGSAAEATLSTLRALGVQDPRLPVLEAQALVLSESAPDAPDRALGLLDAAAARYPGDVDVQRTRLDLVTRYEKWGAAIRALEGYKQALYTRDGSATEAHIASARIFTKMGRLTDALGEYRIALGDQSQNVALWIELGGVSESAGRVETAREAYAMATRLSPNNPDAARGLQRLAERRQDLNEIRLAPGVSN